MSLLVESCKMAFAAVIHNLGKFSRRTENQQNSRFSQQKWEDIARLHPHFKEEAQSEAQLDAAYSMLAFDSLEKYWPDLAAGDMSPLPTSSAQDPSAQRDSLINVAALSHMPQSPLHELIALAARLAAGFDQESFEQPDVARDSTGTGENPYPARLFPFLERIDLGQSPDSPPTGEFSHAYPLSAMSAEALFPVRIKDGETGSNGVAQDQYYALWQSFVAGLEKIPHAHRQTWPLWLDHFDSLWLAYTHAIPLDASYPDISLYDHSKVSAALAVALWRHALATDSLDPDAIRTLPRKSEIKPFLLVQGDFYGIQNFIFPDSSETNRQAAKILRGRSFQVSLFTELAALRVLEKLELPSTSQIINAAGKFLIVAPNTDETVSRLREIQQELDAWFVRHTFGTVGIGMAWLEASCANFSHNTFSSLNKALFESLETAKHRRHDLCRNPLLVLDTEFPKGPCAWQGRFPADREADAEDPASCALSRDQIMMGESLLACSRILIFREDGVKGQGVQRRRHAECELPIFGYRILFSDEDTRSEIFTADALLRCWDISLPQQFNEELWNGSSLRQINAYVPRFATQKDDALTGKYGSDLANEVVRGQLKTFSHIACEDRRPNEKGEWRGHRALAILKGDVDNLGMIFQNGLDDPANGQYPSFAKMVALSRKMNAFFATVLPVLCQTEYPDIYTVFAGGDDFFLIGPWLSTQRLAGKLVEEFDRYVALNRSIHLSAGIAVSAPGSPVSALAREADEALADAKKFDGKNAFSLWKVVDSWQIWPDLRRKEMELEELRKRYRLSSGYLYGLINLLDRRLAEAESPEAALWRSSFAYRTARMLDRTKEQERQEAQRHLVKSIAEDGIRAMKDAFRISLFNYLYQQR